MDGTLDRSADDDASGGVSADHALTGRHVRHTHALVLEAHRFAAMRDLSHEDVSDTEIAATVDIRRTPDDNKCS